MDALLAALNELNESPVLPDNEVVILNNLQHSSIKPLIKQIELLALQVLIDSEGRNVWEFHDLLAAAGFPVSCGERDRFGWLSAVIQTKKGRLIYG